MQPSPPRADRAAVLASLALVLVNLATIGRWAAVPGSLRGWRWPFVMAAVFAAALPSLLPPRAAWRCPAWAARASLAAGVLALAGSFLLDWFPLSTWTLIPFTDDWPPRYQSTIEGIALLRHAAFAGWQWNLLGGYASATDITQSLALLGALPMSLAGNAVGFHLLHLLLFLALPLFVYWDLRLAESIAVSSVAAGLVGISACSLSWGIIRSGDSNSLAGLAAVMAVVLASHRARIGRRFGFTVLVVALAVAIYSHVGFFAYAVALLLLESVYYRDGRHARRVAGACAAALAASLPLTYKLFRYPGEFNFNNVQYARPDHYDWAGIARKIAYNLQILGEPWRWFSDTTKLFAPVLLLVGWRREGRAGFYAWAALFVLAMTCLDVPEAGYVFARSGLMLPIFTPVAVAAFLVLRSRQAWQAAGLAALTVLLVPLIEWRVPHQASVETFAPWVVGRVRAFDGNMVLVENNPHRDVDASPDRTTEKGLYGTHYEAMLPDATGRRLYAGYWDGWQWTPFRGEMLAAGAWLGHTLTNADHDAFIAELHRWGIRHLLVWSRVSTQLLPQWPELRQTAAEGPWREFELSDPAADIRSVATPRGQGDLVAHDPFGGQVRLTGVAAGDRVIVRTHFHPAWMIFQGNRRVPAIADNGQLAFDAPASGNYDVTLIYPRRRWLLLLAGLVLTGCAAGEVAAASRRRRTPRSPLPNRPR